MSTQISMQIGFRLRHLRENNDMTQADLAKRISVTPKAISFYENGEREPSFEVLLQFADIFCVTTDYLLKGEANANVTSLPSVSNEEYDIISQYRRLNRDDKELIQTILRLRANPKMEEMAIAMNAR